MHSPTQVESSGHCAPGKACMQLSTANTRPEVCSGQGSIAVNLGTDVMYIHRVGMGKGKGPCNGELHEYNGVLLHVVFSTGVFSI